MEWKKGTELNYDEDKEIVELIKKLADKGAFTRSPLKSIYVNCIMDMYHRTNQNSGHSARILFKTSGPDAFKNGGVQVQKYLECIGFKLTRDHESEKCDCYDSCKKCSYSNYKIELVLNGEFDKETKEERSVQ
jgi:hypothetical protein